MVATTEFTEYRYRHSRGYLSMRREDEHCRRGTYTHPEGLVEVFENTYPRLKQHVTSMYLTRNGHSYCRRWETTWTDRTLSTLARRFIEDIISEQ
jgi:hypothetical protein